MFIEDVSYWIPLTWICVQSVIYDRKFCLIFMLPSDVNRGGLFEPVIIVHIVRYTKESIFIREPLF